MHRVTIRGSRQSKGAITLYFLCTGGWGKRGATKSGGEMEGRSRDQRTTEMRDLFDIWGELKRAKLSSRPWKMKSKRTDSNMPMQQLCLRRWKNKLHLVSISLLKINVNQELTKRSSLKKIRRRKYDRRATSSPCRSILIYPLARLGSPLLGMQQFSV